MQTKTNKNGVKLLAAIMVFALAFAGAVILISTDDASAEATPTTIYVGGEGASDSESADGSESNPYATISYALNAKKDKTGVKIVELKGDVVGDGWTNPSGNDLTINFNGYTFEMDGAPVGSSGTESQVFQLLKDSNVVFNNGTIKSKTSSVAMIIQNYSNLTLRDMVVDGTGMTRTYAYTMSCNNGVVNIIGSTTIKAADTKGSVAFDVCWGAVNGYPDGTQVTLDSTGVIDGNIEIGDWGVNTDSSKSTFVVKSGIIDGSIIFKEKMGTKVSIDENVAVNVVVPAGETVSGTISFGENTVKFEGIEAGDNGIIFSKGSVAIDGGVYVSPTGSITITGVAKLTGDVTIPSGASILVNSDSQLIIDEGYTLIVEGTADIQGTIVNNGNIITETTIENIEGNEPSTIVDKKLTLKNFNGTSPISGDYEEIILVGDNYITLDETAAEYAIKSEANTLTIKSIDGIGSLTIVVRTDIDGFTAISGKTLNINGVPVTITITGDAENAVAISSETFNIYDSNLTISVCEEDYTGAIGIKTTSGDVDVKSSTIAINAGSIGIVSVKDVIIAASKVIVDASESGITADADVMITNASKVDINVYGLAESIDAVYGITAASVKTQTDSVLTTDGMKIKGTGSQNNATVISNGDVIIEKGADYTNAGSFVNNATFGVYGTLTISSGEFMNNGVLNTYTTYPGTISGSVNIGVNETTGSKLIAIQIKECIALADGTFAIKATITLDSNAVDDEFVGTLTYDGTDLSINAQADGAVLSIYKSNAGYKVFVSGTVTVNGAESVTTVNTDHEADISAVETFFGIASEGKITTSAGKLTNNGSIILNGTSSIEGGEVVNDGTITLNSNISMTAGKLSGNEITIAKTGITVELTGTVDMEFIFSGQYTEGTPATSVDFTDTISVVGAVKGVAFTSTNNATVKGTMVITTLSASETASEVTVKTGKATFSGEVGKNVVLKVLSGSTLEIKTSATAKAGVIAIQDGAEILMKISGNKDTFTYGTLDYTISFANEGFTYYGSLQFALANAAEGATLNLNGEATIDVDTVVKKGITLQFGEGATLIITKDAGAEKKTALSMEEGATFVLAKNATIVIKAGDAVVSGNIVYDGNSIALDKVEFTTADAQIKSVPSTKTDASEISVTGTAIAGTITISEGIASGALTITDDEDANGNAKSVANFVIAAGAVSKNVITDEKHTTITVNGTLNINANQSIKGKVTGDGSIILKDGVVITIDKTSVMDITITNTDASASVELDDVSVADDDSETTMTVTSVAKTATKDAYIALGGDVYKGTVTISGIVGFSGFTINDSAIVVVPADAALNVVSDSKTTGLLKVAGKVNMKVEGDTSTSVYGKFDYQITYEEGIYTVYTYLRTGVENAKSGDSFVIAKDLEVKTMEIPAGVTIEVAEGASLKVLDGHYITIGTAATTIGATTGISGKVILDGSAFLIAYNDASVDLSKAKIVTVDGITENDAKDSQFTVLNIVYATVYVGPSTDNDDVNNVLAPEISGYRFVKWVDVDGKDMVGTGIGVTDNNVGEIDFDAIMNASKVQVTFQQAEGLKYYVDGEYQPIVGAPIYLDYGSIITAVADPGYTGTPLVNGKAYVTVDSTTTTIVGSGVSPATVPETTDDSGMGLTDYLLIVLVILAAILVVVVATRMMRS